jgi:hypothetical protein
MTGSSEMERTTMSESGVVAHLTCNQIIDNTASFRPTRVSQKPLYNNVDGVTQPQHSGQLSAYPIPECREGASKQLSR